MRCRIPWRIIRLRRSTSFDRHPLPLPSAPTRPPSPPSPPSRTRRITDARTLLAYNTGLLRPLQGNPRMSAAGAPGEDRAHKSAAEPMTTRLQALRRVAAVSLIPATVSGVLVDFPGNARAEKGAAAEAKVNINVFRTIYKSRLNGAKK